MRNKMDFPKGYQSEKEPIKSGERNEEEEDDDDGALIPIYLDIHL